MIFASAPLCLCWDEIQFSILLARSGFLGMTALTLRRMSALSDANPYRENLLRNANLFFPGAALLRFGLFHARRLFHVHDLVRQRSPGFARVKSF